MPAFFVDTWDTGLAGATWDSGLSWDVNIGDPAGDINPYLDLITSEHRDKPDFIALLTVYLQGLADLQVTLASMLLKFDLDTAVGDQLDKVGEWVGFSRDIPVALTDVYFSLDNVDLGLDFGSMQGPGDPDTGLVSLPDDAYRTLLRAKVAANHWDGSIPGAYTAWDLAFVNTGFSIKIHDKGDTAPMHMDYELTGPPPDALTLALFTGGFLNLRPAGVMIDNYIVPPP